MTESVRAETGPDGGVIDDCELGRLVAMSRTQLLVVFGGATAGQRKQLDALAALLDDIARRFSVPPPRPEDREELARLLDRDAAPGRAAPATALTLARRIAAAERARMPAPNWSLFS